MPTENTYSTARPVQASDTIDMPAPASAFYVGSAGAVKIRTVDNVDVTFLAVPVGTIIPVQFKRVFVTGTTPATMSSLVALID